MTNYKLTVLFIVMYLSGYVSLNVCCNKTHYFDNKGRSN